MGRGGALGRERPRGGGRQAMALAALVAVLAGMGLEIAAAGHATGAAGGPTRSDFDLLRRKVAQLESELALARSRKPYLVVDAPAKRLRYCLLGATMREIQASMLRIDGLRRTGEGGVNGPLTLAAIVTLEEKEKDPRLSPLTPEQIEAGAADENVADALPPEAPPDFDLRFKQPVSMRVEGVVGRRSVWSRTSAWWSRLWPGRGEGKDRIGLRLAVHLDETAAREVYRSLVPGARLLIVPPAGFLLPDIGQDSPRSVRPGRPGGPPAPQPGPAPQGVPFRIPPPVAEAPVEGTPSAEAGSGGPAAAEAPEPPVEANPIPTPIPDDPPAQAPASGDPPTGGRLSPAPGTGGGA